MHRSITLFACASLLAACEGGSVKETLGIDSRAPDEFRVVSRPPLSVPPQFDLRPPAPADGSIAAEATRARAESLVTGNQTFSLKQESTALTQPEKQQPVASSAESQFLRNAGADAADSGVRRALAEEKIAKQEEVEERSWWDWVGFKPEKKEAVVDAKKEAERIQKNEAEGKPAADGEVATIKPKDRGVLGYILGD